MKNRLKILNIWVDLVTRGEAVDIVHSFLNGGSRPHSIFASNPEKNFSVSKDSDLLEAYKNADLLLPDGIGVVAAANLLYNANLKRNPGSEFIFDICKLAEEEGYKVYCYGSKEEDNKKAVEALKNRYPKLNIAGRSNGYVKDDDMFELIERINRSNAEILFLAMGSPKQEKWFATYKDSLTHVRVVQGIGGTLDTIAGNVKRAPEFWLTHNIEWLYRLLSEPKRIRRQKVLPVFALLVLIEWLKMKLGFSHKPIQ